MLQTRLLLRLVAAVAFSALMLVAQLNRGSITGTVTDNTGAVIPNVKLTLRNTATGAVYEAASNENGQYTAPNLPTGNYDIVFEAPSFKKTERKGVELSVTQVLRVDVTMEVGSITESISVTAETPRLQTDSPDVGTTLSNKQLLDLPLTFAGARVAENFAYLVTPGVSGNTWTSNINGSTSFSKESLLDGTTVTTYLAGHFSESSVSVEALQEFKIQTSGMSAEYGRAQAGVFNYVMKSGANQLHGSAYGALRNEALNANTAVNKFNNRKRGLDRRQNFAFSGGGPIYIPKVYNGTNKTFFYTTFEEYRERLGGFAAPNVTAPQPEFLDGDFSRLLGPSVGTDALGRDVLRGAIYDPRTFRQLDNGRWVGDMFPGNKIPVSRISQVSARANALLKNGYLPTVRNPDGTIPLTNNAIRPAAGTPEFDQYQFSTKVDQNIGTSHKVAGSISYNKRPRLLLDQTRLWNPDDPVGGVLHERTAPDYQERTRSRLPRLEHQCAPSEHVQRLLQPDGESKYRKLRRHRRSQRARHQEPDNVWVPEYRLWRRPVRGTDEHRRSPKRFPGVHGIRSDQHGELLEGPSLHEGRYRSSPKSSQHTSNAGRWIYVQRSRNLDSERDVLGHTDRIRLRQLSARHRRQRQLKRSSRVGQDGVSTTRVFFQDDFKMNSRLTLNLGLRWEYQPPFTEVADRLSSWNPNKVDPATGSWARMTSPDTATSAPARIISASSPTATSAPESVSPIA